MDLFYITGNCLFFRKCTVQFVIQVMQQNKDAMMIMRCNVEPNIELHWHPFGGFGVMPTEEHGPPYKCKFIFVHFM
jgi:hypothetical protein